MPHFSVRHFDQQIIPFADSPDLVWLWPSKQIRAPLFSIKQKKLRRGIVSAIVAMGNSILELSLVNRSSDMESFMPPSFVFSLRSLLCVRVRF